MEAVLALADAYIGTGNYARALEVLEGAESEGDSTEVIRRKATAFFHLEKYREALELYRKLPLDRYIIDRIAMCYFNLGEADEALAWEKRALDEHGDWVTGLVNLSVILASRGDTDEAEEALRKALKLDPSNRVVLENLRRLREALEREGQ